MRDFRNASVLLFIALLVVGITSTAALSGRGQGGGQNRPPKKTPQMIAFEEQFPVADYEAPEPADLKEREKRRAKGEKYDRYKSELSIDPDSDVVTTSSHWAAGLPALPVNESVAVVVGNILSAQGHMSSNKKKVYSEFTISVEDVLKNDAHRPVRPGKPIVADRIGGRVKFQNGKVGMYWVTGQGMPRVGRRYLLFLTCAEQGPDFDILTGYELRDGRAYLLDQPGSGHPLTARHGAEETVVLDDIRAAIAKQ